MANPATAFMQALLSLDRIRAKAIMTDQVNQRGSLEFIETIIVDALAQIGTGWESGTIALAQVYMSGRICEELVDDMLPPGDPDRKDQPKMAICVLADYHMLGKQIVYSLLRASGFDLLDYGRVTESELIERAVADGVKLLLISTLMLPAALQIQAVTRRIKQDNLGIKTIVGGAPFRFDDQLWQTVGADGVCLNASQAASTIQAVMRGVA